MSTQNTNVLHLDEILHEIINDRIVIVIFTVVGLMAGMAISIASYIRSEMNKNYTVTTSIAVTSVTEDGLFTSHSDNPDSSDIYLAEDMVDAVIYVIQGDTTLNAAIEALSMPGLSVKDIRNNLSMSQYKQTQIIEITLKWPVAEEGIRILTAINEVAPEILIESLKIGSVSVVDMPKSGSLNTSTVNVKQWVIMAMAGLVLGISYAVAKYLCFPTVFGQRLISDKLGLEFLGGIPYSNTFFVNPFYQKSTEYSADTSKVQQSFVALAHALQHRFEDEKPVCMYVTSTFPNEGKTSVLANLAIELAGLEYKVLMVDMDVNNPSLGPLFIEDVDYYHSINAAYRGETAPALAVEHVQPCLDLLPMYLEKNKLMLRDEMLEILRQLSTQYDFVLMDSSPVGISADTMSLNRVAQAVLFVVRQDVTPVKQAEEALTRLNKSGIPVAGAVLNGMHKLGEHTRKRTKKRKGKSSDSAKKSDSQSKSGKHS